MKFIYWAFTLALCFQPLAPAAALDWFPANIGNVWTYEHEVRVGSAQYPQVTRWQTVETITGSIALPEGKIILRHVEFEGDSDGSWIAQIFAELNYFVRGNCLYFLDPEGWDGEHKRIRPDYLLRIVDGDKEPEFCFPLTAGASFGKNQSPGWYSSHVIGKGSHGHFPDTLISHQSFFPQSFDVLTHITSGDTTHLWFEKGVGLTGIWDRHNGTYFEYRAWLRLFQPTIHNTAPPN